jgi:hypothetical protein
MIHIIAKSYMTTQVKRETSTIFAKKNAKMKKVYVFAWLASAILYFLYNLWAEKGVAEGNAWLMLGDVVGLSFLFVTLVGLYFWWMEE